VTAGTDEAPAKVTPVEDCDLMVTDRVWPFAADRASEIDAHWQRRCAESPSLFNGRVYMLSSYTIADGRLTGKLFPVQFKQFLYWKDQGAPDASVYDVFGSALICSSDGAILLGRQRAGNVNAGLFYLPGGFIDSRDTSPDGRVDLRASVLREVREETGLAPQMLAARDGYLVTTVGRQVSIAVDLIGDADAATLQDRIRHAFGADAEPELEEIVAVRSWDDVAALPVPHYARVLLAHLMQRRPDAGA